MTSQILPNCILVHEDDFYKHDEEVPIDSKYGIRNWDSPEALDFDLFEKELDIIKRTGNIAHDLIHNNNVDDITKFSLTEKDFKDFAQRYDSINPDIKLVIVDGFMIYNNPKIASKFDLKLFIRAPYEVLKRRRAARSGYQTLDSFWIDPPYYFDEFVYRSYKNSHASLFVDGDVEGELNSSSPIAKDIKEFKNDDNTLMTDALTWTCNEIVNFLLCEN